MSLESLYKVTHTAPESRDFMGCAAQTQSGQLPLKNRANKRGGNQKQIQINSNSGKWKHDCAESSEPGDVEDDGDARGFFFFCKMKVQCDQSDSRCLVS